MEVVLMDRTAPIMAGVTPLTPLQEEQAREALTAALDRLRRNADARAQGYARGCYPFSDGSERLDVDQARWEDDGGPVWS
jgi:hypothetical protein